MFTPENEQGVIVVFAMQANAYGWEILRIGCPFPDALLQYQGQEWRAEFEYAASNFLAHRHDHRQCDLIVCWENDYPDCPLPILALGETDWQAKELSKAHPDKAEIEYWKQRALRSERQLALARPDVFDEDDPRERAKQLRAEGLSNGAIAEALGRDVSTIGRWFKAMA